MATRLGRTTRGGVSSKDDEKNQSSTSLGVQTISGDRYKSSRAAVALSDIGSRSLDISSTLASDVERAYAEDVFFSVPYVRIAEQSFFEISLIAKSRVPAHLITLLANDLNLERSLLVRSLGLSQRATRASRSNRVRLTVGDSERVIGCAAALGEVMRILSEAAEENAFDVGGWLGDWLTRPLPALGFRRPISLLDTMAGQHVIVNLLRCIESGSFA